MNTPTTRLRIPRRAHTATPPTRYLCEAARSLGVTAADIATPPAHQPIHITARPGEIILIVGPSGSGKTTLLRDASTALAESGWTTLTDTADPLRNLPCIDLVAAAHKRGARSYAAAAEAAMRVLARAGLGEAGVFARRPAELSAGQRHRLRLALLLQRAEHELRRHPQTPVALLIDELGTTLDDATSRAVALLLARFINHHPGAMLLAATLRPSLARLLNPTPTPAPTLAGRASIHASAAPPAPALPPPIIIEPGDRADYRALAPLHYLPGPPATISGILRAVDPATGELIGVLVASMPTLNSSWRRLAWGARYQSRDKPADARRLNDELRCISRVIVDPSWRGLAVARRLVRAYLDAPQTPSTEAIAAMGRAAPFFERAGMTAYPVPRTHRDQRLLSLIEQAGVEPWRLAQPASALDRCTRVWGTRAVHHELHRWANWSRASRTSLNRASTLDLFTAACRNISARRTAYLHTTLTQGPEDRQFREPFQFLCIAQE